MTLLEKIKNYKWFDSPNKLRVILEELYNSIGGGSGGGSQDLQSVLDNGATAEYDGGLTYASIMEGVTNNRRIEFYIEESMGGAGFQVKRNNSFFGVSDTSNENASDINLKEDLFRMTRIDAGKKIIVEFPTNLVGNSTLIKYPNKPNGTYTLATLDDIKKIDLTGRVYENNVASISGGLTVNDVYRTSTGELRIVV